MPAITYRSCPNLPQNRKSHTGIPEISKATGSVTSDPSHGRFDVRVGEDPPRRGERLRSSVRVLSHSAEPSCSFRHSLPMFSWMFHAPLCRLGTNCMCGAALSHGRCENSNWYSGGALQRRAMVAFCVFLRRFKLLCEARRGSRDPESARKPILAGL
jgi:hypothetical protein